MSDTSDTTPIVRQWLTAIENQYDPGTIRHLLQRGVSAGWRCLEVGAGSGTMAHWLAKAVGSSGRVVATDLDLRFLKNLAEPNLEVWQHDLVADPLPSAEFDLVHSRLLLEHLPQRDAVLHKLVAAVKVGGWLVVEENDNISIAPDPAMADAAALHNKVRSAAGRLVCARTRRADGGTYGRQLLGILRRLGLADVDAEGRVFMVRGQETAALPWQLLYQQIGPALLASGAITELELTEYTELLRSPGFIAMGEIMMAAWGRKTQPQG